MPRAKRTTKQRKVTKLETPPKKVSATSVTFHKSEPVSVALYIFIIGLVIAFILAIVATANVGQALTGSHWTNSLWVWLVMFVFGILIGLVMIQKEKLTNFLITAIAFVFFTTVLSARNGVMSIDVLIPYVGTFLMFLLRYLTVIVGTSGLVIAIKEIIKFFYK